MTTTIKLKNGTGVPTSGALVQGEPAFDLTNKRLYTENAGGTVIEVGTNPSTIVIPAGTINGTTIGATTPASVAATTLSTTGAATFGGATKFGSAAVIPGFAGANDAALANNMALRGTNAAASTSFALIKLDASDAVQINSDGASVVNIAGAATTMGGTLTTTGAATFGGNITKSVAPAANGGIVVNDGTNDLIALGSGGFSANGGLATDGGIRTAANFVIATGAGSPERMRIDASGRSLFGHIAAIQGARVEISAVGDGAALALFGRASDNSAYIGFYQNGVATRTAMIQANPAAGLQFIGGSGGTLQMTLDASGNLLLGTTSVAGIGTSVSENNGKCLIIQNTSTVSANTMTQFKNPNGIVGQIICTGSTTAYNTSSDQRLKENITDANDAGNKIDAIKVRQYDWKADGSHQDYGMVAQELMTVAPEAVSGDPESDEMMGVDYSKLVPMMLKEIQSLRARISQLEGAN
jgi:hypothetical protein